MKNLKNKIIQHRYVIRLHRWNLITGIHANSTISIFDDILKDDVYSFDNAKDLVDNYSHIILMRVITGSIKIFYEQFKK
jgi:signal-transduction protein with cAMP-binding, CBS, and nucleotidyltransferase domain